MLIQVVTKLNCLIFFILCFFYIFEDNMHFKLKVFVIQQVDTQYISLLSKFKRSRRIKFHPGQYKNLKAKKRSLFEEYIISNFSTVIAIYINRLSCKYVTENIT